MLIRILKKVQPAQWLSAVGLLTMMVICIRVAVALSGVTASFNPNTMPTGVTAQEVVSNATLTSGNESLFRSDFEKEFWSGNIYDYPINAAGIVNTAGERWSGGFAPNLEAQVNPQGVFNVGGRFIGTMTDTGSKVPFLSANLSTAQNTALAATIQSTNYTSTQIVNFLRGDHSNEGLTALRQRLMPGGVTTLPTSLGDIVHCRPYYLADAINPTVFVGANDGMLHAIDVNAGTESWAYVPSMLLSKMNGLAANPYVHDYYVDGQIAVGYTNTTTTQSPNGQRILVGALGAGGKGLYALNIDGTAGLTAASDQDAANKVIWEITPTSVKYNSATTATTAYANLGYTLSAPIFKNIKNGSSTERVILVGNGYNSGGDYQAYLYVIKADDGSLVAAIKADNTSSNPTNSPSSAATTVTQGTAASPNGLMNLLAFDSLARGYDDTAYAGDLNGTLWKFDLVNFTASVVYVTNPKQPITATPAALPHPAGTGNVIDFATGSIFAGTQPITGSSPTGDLGDTSTFYAYGIWDGAPSTNTTLVNPTLTERCYDAASAPTALPCSTTSSTVTRVRRVSASTPNWAEGGDKGWKIAFPISGERVVGDGSFISSGRYYFSTYNPTISYLVPTTTTYVWGENWQMALDAVTGGSVDPFMDLNGDGSITAADRIHYTAAENTANTPVNTPILTPNVDGIEVGKWVGRGVQSQPVLVKLANLFTTLFNTNPDVTIPVTPVTGTGVTGGHFDEDIYFGAVTASAQAKATITVGSQTAGVPASLGGITIGGSTVVPAMSFGDGSQTSTNATAIKNAVTGGVYTATVQGSTVTLTAPSGSSYNGQTMVVLSGTSITPVTGVAAVQASQTITFTNSVAINPTGVTIMVSVNGGTATNIMTATSPGSAMTSSQLAAWVASHSTLTGFTISNTAGSSVVTITANANGPAYNISSVTVSSSETAASDVTLGAATPGITAVPVTPGVYASRSITFTNGSNASTAGLSLTVNGGATILTSSTPGAQSANALATWVASHSALTGYTITNPSNGVVTITSNTQDTTHDISSIAVAETTSAIGYTLAAPTAGKTAPGAKAASDNFTFTNTANVNPTNLTVTVNGTNILTAAGATPGSQSSSGLATWVAGVAGVAGHISPAFSANYTVAASGSKVTITAKASITTTWDISSIVVSASTAPSVTNTIGALTAGVVPIPAVTGVAASRSFTFTNTTAVNPTGLNISVNGTNILSSASPGSNMTSSQLATWVAGHITAAFATNYTVVAGGSTVTITAKTMQTTTYDISSITVSGTAGILTSTLGTAVAGVAAVAAVTGQTNMATALATTTFSGGTDGSTAGDTCTGASGSQCKKDTHDHQYDKIYDVTGVDMLNPNDLNFILSRAIPSKNQNFKVILQNQYLNPAVQFNIGNSNYLPNVNFGYVSVKNYTTSATLDLATLPTYNRNPASTGDGFTATKYIASLAFNMPVDALTAKNWWGNGDLRAGLIPTQPGCVYNSVGATDGNMYQPVNPPAFNSSTGYPPDGPGTLGYSSSTTPATATGVRHGGAFTVQVIKDTTPNSAIELQVSGRPEYGWRVISSLFSTYVLAEYTTYWHHPNGKCFGTTGWTKAPGPDTAGNPPTPQPRLGATDPKIGNLSGNSGNSSVTSVTVTGNTTTIIYANGTSTVIIRVVNADGTVTTVTINIPGGVMPASAIVNSDKSIVVTVGGVSATIAAGSSGTVNGAVVTNTTTANAAGASVSGGLLNQNAIGYRRISWKELHRN